MTRWSPTAQRPSGEMAKHFVALAFLNLRTGRLVWRSHRKQVPAKSHDPSQLSSGEKATAVTRVSCPTRTTCFDPVLVSQTITDRSSLPEASRLPLEEMATAFTDLLCPCRLASLSCSRASQIK